MKRYLLFLLCFACFLGVWAQNSIDKEHLQSVVWEGQRQWSYGFMENNTDSLLSAISRFEEYVDAFRDNREMIGPDDPWPIFAMLSMSYNRTDNYRILSFIDKVVRPYYKECGDTCFRQYYGVAVEAIKYLSRPHQPTMSEREQVAKFSSMAIELNEAAESANEKSLILAMCKYSMAWSEGMKGNFTESLKWLEKSREAGMLYMGNYEENQHDYLLYLEMLGNLIQGYATISKYDKGIEVADQMATLSHSISNQFLIVALSSKAELLFRKGEISAIAPIIEQIDSVSQYENDIHPQTLQCARTLVQQYRNYSQQSGATTNNGQQEGNLGQQTGESESFQNDYLDQLTAMESDNQMDLYNYNTAITQIVDDCYQKQEPKMAMDVLDHANNYIRDQFGQIPYATRVVEGLYASVWQMLGNMPRALRYLHKSAQMFEMAGDHGLLYYDMMSRFVMILYLAGDIPYAKLYLDRINAFVEDNFNDSDKAIPELENIKVNLSISYCMLGYTQAADSIIRTVPEEDLLHQQGLLWDQARLAFAIMNLVKGDYKTADLFARKNLENTTSENILISSLNGLVSMNCLMRNPDAISFYERFQKIKEQQVDRVMADFDPSGRQSYWEQQIHEMSNLSNLVLDRFSGESAARKLAYNTAVYAKSMQDKASHPCNRWTDVRQHLAENEVTIEFVAIPDTLGDKYVRYGALLLRKEYNSPVYVDLCPTDSIGKICDEAMNSAGGQNVIHTNIKFINNLYSTTNTRIYNLLWSKFSSFLKPGDVIYYSTIGLLDRINHSAVSNGKQRLADIYTMNQVSTTAIVTELKDYHWHDGRNAVIYGGIDYNMNTNQMALESSKYKRETGQVERTEFTRGGLGTRSASRIELKGTLEEAMVIDKVLQNSNYSTTLLTGTKANEESFKALNGKAPQILHIGTHGFAIETTHDVDKHYNIVSQGLDRSERRRNLMQYYGLRLAGSNNAWFGKDVPANVEDGILTAYEISQLDLSGCDLVVLSSCESGLGGANYTGNKIGLIQALKMAGVGTVVASLWEVPDKATSMLMQHMFTYIANGDPPRVALEKAQKIVQQKYPDPYNWAAFILQDAVEN